MIKAYELTILEKYPTDTETQELDPVNLGACQDFVDYASAEIKTIRALFSQLALETDDSFFDRMYRKNHVLFGLASILGLHKITHLLSILDFIFDFGRMKSSLNDHSIPYLIDLIYNTLQDPIFKEVSNASLAYDISYLIDECKTYLYNPLETYIQEKAYPHPKEAKEEDTAHSPQTDQTPSPEIQTTAASPNTFADATQTDTTNKTDPPHESTSSGTELNHLEQTNLELTHLLKNIPFGDEPEALDIPQDKIGFISDFYEESSEMLSRIGNQLIELETATEDEAIVNDLFRNMHTVKGGARLLKIRKMEYIAHHLENLLQQIRDKEIQIIPEIIDLLLSGKQVLSDILEEVTSRGPIRTRIKPVLSNLFTLLNHSLSAPAETITEPVKADISKETHPSDAETTPTNVLEGESPQTPLEEHTIQEIPTALEPSTVSNISPKNIDKTAESIRVSTEKLDEVLNTASEIFVSRIKFQSEINTIKNIVKSIKHILTRANQLSPGTILSRLNDVTDEFIKDLTFNLHKNAGSIEPKVVKELLTKLFKKAIGDDLGEELSIEEEITLNYIALDDIRKQLQKNLETFEHLSSRLQNKAMGFRMVPISTLFDRFPTQVREMARTLGKKVKLEIIGGDTELDKVLINKLTDPMLHMLRNSVDHGIEEPNERIQSGKPDFGTITLKTYYHGSHAIIEVQDDGKGINANKVFDRAVQKKLVELDKKEKLTDSEIFDFLFMPGFSTSDTVSELSGRGVGMDVVKTSISQLHGSIEISSTLGQGTIIRLKLPLTLAIVRILLVKDGIHQFAFPLLNILEIITINKKDLKTVEDRVVYNLRGRTIPVSTLSSILDFETHESLKDTLQMVILSENNKIIGIVVSEILGRQEILIKNLGKLLKKVPYIMGCTILKDSRLVLILDPREIVQTYESSGVNLDLTHENASLERSIQKKNILVIDDSSIQRDNLRNTLNKYGYNTDTAENGFEALKTVKTKIYAAFCVDIVMPLMDGYEFVERLRKIDLYKQTPVFLITGRGDSTLDQQRSVNLNITNKFQKPVEEHTIIDALEKALNTSDMEQG